MYRRFMGYVAGSVLLLAATFGPATADNFLFSFTNTSGNTPGTVTGEIFGLVNNSISSATDVTITSAPPAIGLPSFPFDMFPPSFTFANSFAVLNDSIPPPPFTFFNLVLVGSQSSPPFTLILRSPNIQSLNDFASLTNVNTSAAVASPDITFTSPIAQAIPGPIAGAGLPGLLFAAGGFLAWWRRKRTAAGVVAAAGPKQSI